jgi:hypothetical protein
MHKKHVCGRRVLHAMFWSLTHNALAPVGLFVSEQVLMPRSNDDVHMGLLGEPFGERVSALLYLTNTRGFSGMLNLSVEPVLQTTVAIMSAPGG